MPKDPESLGGGLGGLLADYIPLLPSGSRRAGAAEVMAARVRRKPSMLVRHPLKTQLAAMALGGAGGFAANVAGASTPTWLAASFGPTLLVQFLRRQELKSIQKDYDRKKRKRLREIDQDGLTTHGIFGGSRRLGAVGAIEAMRKRKYQDIGSIAESGDALMLASGLNPAMIPVTGGIDYFASRRLQKKADWTDQKNSPTIPLYLLAAALGFGGHAASTKWAINAEQNSDPLPHDQWAPLTRDISGSSPMVYAAPGLNNAFFAKPTSEKDAAQLLRYLEYQKDLGGDDRTTAQKTFAQNLYSERERKLKRLMNKGVIVGDADSSAATLAHEAGHAKIENTPGFLRFLQRHVYPKQHIITPLSAAGSMAAGLASGSTLKGALLGTGIGAIGGIGQLAPEIGASYYGAKGLPDNLSSGSKANLISALSTYLAANVLPGTLSGAVGGYLSGKRKRNPEVSGKAK